MDSQQFKSFNRTQPLVLVQIYDASVNVLDLRSRLDAILINEKETLVQVVLLDARRNLDQCARPLKGKCNMSAYSNVLLTESCEANAFSVFREFCGPQIQTTLRQMLSSQLYDASMTAFKTGDATVAPGMIYVLEAGVNSKLELQRKHRC